MAYESSHPGWREFGLMEGVAFGLVATLTVLVAGALIGGLVCLAIAIGQAIAELQGVVTLLP